MFSYSSDLRLKSKEDFQNLRSGSLRFVSSSFIVYYKKNQHPCSRLGLSISKKVCNAVYRNNIKRISREVFRKSDFRSKSFDCLVVTKASFVFNEVWKKTYRNELIKFFSALSFHKECVS